MRDMEQQMKLTFTPTHTHTNTHTHVRKWALSWRKLWAITLTQSSRGNQLTGANCNCFSWPSHTSYRNVGNEACVCVCVSCYYDSDIASSCSRSCRYSLSFSSCSNWILITTEFTFRPLASGDNKKKINNSKSKQYSINSCKICKKC